MEIARVAEVNERGKQSGCIVYVNAVPSAIILDAVAQIQPREQADRAGAPLEQAPAYCPSFHMFVEGRLLGVKQQLARLDMLCKARGKHRA
jgi:hypothetical protein